MSLDSAQVSAVLNPLLISLSALPPPPLIRLLFIYFRQLVRTLYPRRGALAKTVRIKIICLYLVIKGLLFVDFGEVA